MQSLRGIVSCAVLTDLSHTMLHMSGAYCGAAREKAGRRGREEAVAARASGRRAFVNEAIVSTDGMGETGEPGTTAACGGRK